MTKKIRLHRRTLLKGAAGTAVALPLLECMLDDKPASAATNCKRYFVSQGGFSLNKSQNGAPTTQHFVPNSYGAGYDVKAAMAPLMSYNDANGNPVRDVVTPVSGLDIPHAQSLQSQPPASRYIGDSFHFHVGPMFAGVKQIHELNAEVTGESSDIVLRNALSPTTQFPHLTTRVQASFYNLGESSFHRDTMSFEDVNGTIVAVEPRHSPKQLYDALFTNFTPDDPVDAQNKAKELLRRKSVLDVVDRHMDGMRSKLGAWDKLRIERHLEQVRELELLLEGTQPPAVGNGHCMLLPDPGPDPAVGADFQQPFSWNANDGWSEEDSRARVMTRLIHMAFVCDLTRIVAHMYTMFQSFMNIHQLIGASFNQHAMNHNGNQGMLDDVIAWHIDHFAELVAMLRDTPEAGGSVLDNCAMVFVPEGGYRDALTPVPGGWSHNTENMCVLVAGGASGLKQGEHIAAPQGRNHPVNVLISLMQAAGYQGNTLGEVSGEISELFG